jgi:hypothetical protein
LVERLLPKEHFLRIEPNTTGCVAMDNIEPAVIQSYRTSALYTWELYKTKIEQFFN